MSVVQKIDDAYTLYCFSGQNITETLKITTFKRPTLLKYIKIKERLDMSLFDHLDKKKGRKKLTLEMAFYICRNVLNPEYQHHIFESIQDLPKAEMKQRISELSECIICADQSRNFELTPCCGQFLCEGCFVHIAESAIEDLTFKPINCPFCQQSLTLDEAKDLLIVKYNHNKSCDLWKTTGDYYHSLTLNSTYSRNLFQKFMMILGAIERSRGLIRSDERMGMSSRDYEAIIGTDLYYGCCTACTPDMSRYQRVNYQRIRIGSVEKQCAIGENELAVLEPGQFLCTICKSFQEDPEDGTFKKCPHCGIRTLKPEGCNFVRCGDHRWCFICNERLENNNEGHNVHYHTGLPGASAYASECRVSLDQDKPSFVLKTCECSDCKEHGGAPLCRELECMNRTKKDKDIFNTLCNECIQKREKDLIYERQIAQGLLTNYYRLAKTPRRKACLCYLGKDKKRRYVKDPYLLDIYYREQRFRGLTRMGRDLLARKIAEDRRRKSGRVA
jgi:hypothetical protein